MRPFIGGGDMIREVTRTCVYNDAPMKFEAGTPGIVQTIGLGVALDYMMGLGMADIAAHENRLRDYAVERLAWLNWLQVQGTAPDKAAIFRSHWTAQAMRMTSRPFWTRRASRCVRDSTVRGPLMEHLGVAPPAARHSGCTTPRPRVDALDRRAWSLSRSFCVTVARDLSVLADVRARRADIPPSKAPLAQLDRALPSEGRGQRFESSRVRHLIALTHCI